MMAKRKASRGSASKFTGAKNFTGAFVAGCAKAISPACKKTREEGRSYLAGNSDTLSEEHTSYAHEAGLTRRLAGTGEYRNNVLSGGREEQLMTLGDII